MWSWFSQIVRGTGFNFKALIAVAIAVVLIERLDNKHGFFGRSSLGTLIVASIFGLSMLCFVGMSATGFWQKMELYDMKLGSDPNVGNVFWLVGKMSVFWLLFPMVKRRDYEVPLKMDPKVLVW